MFSILWFTIHMIILNLICIYIKLYRVPKLYFIVIVSFLLELMILPYSYNELCVAIIILSLWKQIK
jgi:hypothetical protein